MIRIAGVAIAAFAAVYVMNQDFPSFYKLSATPPNAGPSPAARARAAGGDRAADRGRTMYEETCQACHGADRAESSDLEASR